MALIFFKMIKNVEELDMLKTGDKAPTFSLESDTGRTVSLSDYAGKRLVLFFYPRDNTSG